jgi:CBS domain-containing protein
MRPASELATVSPEDELVAAIDRFGSGDLPILPVVDHGSLVGVLFRDAVVGYVRMQESLGLNARR